MLQYLFNSSFGGAEYLLANYRGEGMESLTNRAFPQYI